MRATKRYKRDLADKKREEEKKQKKIEILAKARAVKAEKAKNKEEVKDNGC
jgi:Sec-independent protein translocase protein TatA